MKVAVPILIALLALIAGTGIRTVSADSYFDDYGNIPWKVEKLHLDGFAFYLERNPNYTGYIGYRVGFKDSPTRVEKRAWRARNYLVSVLKIEAKRIVVVNAGRRNETQTILQPVNSNLPPPFD